MAGSLGARYRSGMTSAPFKLRLNLEERLTKQHDNVVMIEVRGVQRVARELQVARQRGNVHECGKLIGRKAHSHLISNEIPRCPSPF